MRLAPGIFVLVLLSVPGFAQELYQPFTIQPLAGAARSRAMISTAVDMTVNVDPVQSLVVDNSVLNGVPLLSATSNLGYSIPVHTGYSLSGKMDNVLDNTQDGAMNFALPFGGILIHGFRDQEFTTREHNQTDQWGGEAKVLLRPFKNNNLSLFGSYSTVSNELPGPLTLDQYHNTPDFSDPLYSSDTSTASQGSLGAQWDFGSTLFHLTIPFNGAVNYTNSHIPSQPTTATTLTTFYDTGIQPRVELMVPRFLGGALTLGMAAGASFQHLDFNQSPLVIDQNNGTYSAQVDRWGINTWFAFQENWGSLFYWSGCVRYDWSVTLVNVPVIPPSTLPLVYSTAFTWEPETGTKVTASAATIYNMPGVASMVPSVPQPGVSTPVNMVLKPETGYLVGLDGELPLWLVILQTGGTATVMNDKVVTVGTDPSNLTTINLDGSTLDTKLTVGLDFPVPLLPFHLGSFDVGVKYIYDSVSLLTGSSVSNLTNGPTHSGGFTVGWSPIPTLRLSGDGSYSSAYTPEGSVLSVNTQTRYNAGVSYNFGRKAEWNVQAACKNITDNRDPATTTVNTWYPVPGRTFWVGLGLLF